MLFKLKFTCNAAVLDIIDNGTETMLITLQAVYNLYAFKLVCLIYIQIEQKF